MDIAQLYNNVVEGYNSKCFMFFVLFDNFMYTSLYQSSNKIILKPKMLCKT